jgi:YesN/AraC family two-component response regulator
MYKVLIVDDEAPSRTAIRSLGHWSDYHITEFYEEINGTHALKSMREVHPLIVFVDLPMPVMDRMEFLEKASCEFPESRFIVTSESDSFSYAKKVLRIGAVDYLLKPLRTDELNAAIDRAISSLEPSIFSKRSSGRISPDEAVSLIRQDIDRHYSSPLRISQYAHQYFFTQEYLTRLFRQHYHVSIQEYLLRVRMTRAKELLNDPTIQIQEVAARVGYPDNNYFSKAFRSFYGISPSCYRKEKSCRTNPCTAALPIDL